MTSPRATTAEPATDISDPSRLDEDRAAQSHRPRPISFVALVVVALVAIVGVVASVRSNHRVEERRRTELADVVGQYEVALAAHNWTALEQLLAPDLTVHNEDYGSTQDRHGFVAWARTIGDSYPDFTASVDEIALVGDIVTVRFHESEQAGLVTGVVKVRIVERRLVEMWSNYDEFGLLHERGLHARA